MVRMLRFRFEANGGGEMKVKIKNFNGESYEKAKNIYLQAVEVVESCQ